MSDGNDNGKMFHIRLNRYDREALEFMKNCHGVSASSAIRICIRVAAWKLGLKKPDDLPEAAE